MSHSLAAKRSGCSPFCQSSGQTTQTSSSKKLNFESNLHRDVKLCNGLRQRSWNQTIVWDRHTLYLWTSAKANKKTFYCEKNIVFQHHKLLNYSVNVRALAVNSMSTTLWLAGTFKTTVAKIDTEWWMLIWQTKGPNQGFQRTRAPHIVYVVVWHLIHTFLKRNAPLPPKKSETSERKHIKVPKTKKKKHVKQKSKRHFKVKMSLFFFVVHLIKWFHQSKNELVQ